MKAKYSTYQKLFPSKDKTQIYKAKHRTYKTQPFQISEPNSEVYNQRFSQSNQQDLQLSEQEEKKEKEENESILHYEQQIEGQIKSEEEIKTEDQKEEAKPEDEDNQGILKTQRLKISKKEQRQNGQSLRIQYKKIADVYEEKQLQEEAKKFVAKLKFEKQRYKGKFHLRKIQEAQRKKQLQRKEQQCLEEKKILEINERKSKALKNIQLLKKKAENRQKNMIRRQSLSRRQVVPSPTSPNSQPIIKEKKTLSPTPTPCERNKIGNQYLSKFGRGHHKSRSFSVATQRNEYRYLLQEEKLEIEQLRKKIKVLKSIVMQ